MGGDPRARRPAVDATWPNARRVTGARGTNVTTPKLSVVPSAAPRLAGEVTVLVCSSCRHPDEPESETRPGSALVDDTRRAAAGTGVVVRQVACLGNCRRGLTAAVFRTAAGAMSSAGCEAASGADLGRGGAAFRAVDRRVHAVPGAARGLEARADRPHSQSRHPEGAAMSELGDRPRSLHRRHRVSRGGEDDADPACAGECRRAAVRGDRERVRRHRDRRGDPAELRGRGTARTRTSSSWRTGASAARWRTTSCRRWTGSWRWSRGWITS